MVNSKGWSRPCLCGIRQEKRGANIAVDELKQHSAHEYMPATSVALIYAGLGEKDQAFAWLDKGVRTARFSNAMDQVRPKMGQSTLRPTFRGLDGAHRSSRINGACALFLRLKLEATRTSEV